MTGITAKILFAALFTGIISLDRSAFGQFQLSRPLVAAPLMGAVLGCPLEGALIGLTYELLFLNSLPVGSFIPYHPLFPSLVSVLLVAVYKGPHHSLDLLGPAIFLGLPSVFLDRAVDIQWRRSNERAFHRAMVFLRLGRPDLAQQRHLLSIGRAAVFHGAAFLLTAVIFVPVFKEVLKFSDYLPDRLAVVALLPFFVGLAGLSYEQTSRRGWRGFALGIILGAGIGLWRSLH